MKAKKGDKVMCVKNIGYKYITIDKIYEVLGISLDGGFYFISNDISAGSRGFYETECFMKLNEWREQQINKIL